jgi:hypothetical protein
MITPLNQPLVAYRTEHLAGLIRNPAITSAKIPQGMALGGKVSAQAGSFGTPGPKFDLMPINDRLAVPARFAMQAVPFSRINNIPE